MDLQLPVHIPAGQGECLWVAEALTSILLTGKETGGQFALFDIEVTPCKGTPPHVHTREDESFIVMEGTVDFWVDGETITVPKGGVLFGPRDVPHCFTNNTSEMARLYVIVTPAGLEEFFRTTGDATTAPHGGPPPVNVEKLTADCEAYGMRLLPPNL